MLPLLKRPSHLSVWERLFVSRVRNIWERMPCIGHIRPTFYPISFKEDMNILYVLMVSNQSILWMVVCSKRNKKWKEVVTKKTKWKTKIDWGRESTAQFHLYQQSHTLIQSAWEETSRRHGVIHTQERGWHRQEVWSNTTAKLTQFRHNSYL